MPWCNAASLRTLGFRHPRHGELHRVPLKRADHLEMLQHLFAREPPHTRAAAGQQLQQAFGGEQLYRLADWRA